MPSELCPFRQTLQLNELPPISKGFHCPLRVGFEPTQEDPNGFQVHRLNHSAIAAAGNLLSTGGELLSPIIEGLHPLI